MGAAEGWRVTRSDANPCAAKTSSSPCFVIHDVARHLRFRCETSCFPCVDFYLSSNTRRPVPEYANGRKPLRPPGRLRSEDRVGAYLEEYELLRWMPTHAMQSGLKSSEEDPRWILHQTAGPRGSVRLGHDSSNHLKTPSVSGALSWRSVYGRSDRIPPARRPFLRHLIRQEIHNSSWNQPSTALSQPFSKGSPRSSSDRNRGRAAHHCPFHRWAYSVGGAPGLAKTLLANTLPVGIELHQARPVHHRFSPPTSLDLAGESSRSTFTVQKGPIFTPFAPG